MISIEYDAETKRYKATINLKGTAGVDKAPFGTAANEPHTIGFGNCPESAVRDAYQCLGSFLYYTKTINIPREGGA